MYRYICAAVSIENLRQQAAKPIFDNNSPEEGEEIFKQLIEIDPTADYESNKGGKYAPWIIRQYNKGNLDERNYQNLRDALKHFAVQPRHYNHTDLGQYKTVEEFLQDSARVGNLPLTEKEKARILKKQAHRASTEDKEFVTSDGVWELWIPKTHAGSISLAREGGTKAEWCTAYEGRDYHWKHYTEGYREGTLYIFLNTSDPKEKYQLHFGSNSWFDIHDDSLGMTKFYEFIADKPNFAAYFKVTNENGLLVRAGTIVGVDPDVTDLVIPDGIDRLSISEYPDGLVSITYPDNVNEWIGPALGGYFALESIHLPANLSSIPAKRIFNCPALTKVDFPTNLTNIEGNNFTDCSALSDIELPDTISIIGMGCFKNTAIHNFRFPDAMRLVPPKFFEDNTELRTVDLNNIEVIRSQAFLNAAIGPVNGFSTVKKFYAESFKGSNLTEVDFNPEVLIGSYAFEGCQYLSGSIELLSSMKIGIGSFDNCPQLTIYWQRDDSDYEFDNIKKLVCSSMCKQLIAANKGYIEIETIEGDHYDAEV